MSKSVLISIHPKWCELIANGKKTIEVRKTRPKLKTPFKCYIYCTKAKDYFSVGNGVYACRDELYRLPTGDIKFGDSFELAANWFDEYSADNFLNGKVIGEFVCDEISKFTAEFTDGKAYEDIRYHYFDECEDEQEMIVVSNEWKNPNNSWICKESCLSFDDFKKYIGVNFHDIAFYTWHISDLKIYDKPKELREFSRFGANFKGCACLNRTCKNYIDSADYDCPPDCKIADCFLTRPPQSWCYVEEME